MLSPVRFCFRNIICIKLMNYSTQREARMLDKMLRKGSKQTRVGLQKTGIASNFLSNPFGNEGENERLASLNKIYMQEIILLMETKECCLDLYKLGFELSKVKLSNSRRHLKIYWVAQSESTPEGVIEKKLGQVAGEIQRDLGRMNYFGGIPKISFVHDLTLQRAMKVDQIILSEKFCKEIGTTHPDKIYTEFDNKPGERTPEMRQNVLGLDHEKIKNFIREEMKNHKLYSPKGELEQSQVDPGPLVSFNKADFKKFLKRKFVLDRKMEGAYGKPYKDINKEPIEESYEDEIWEYNEEGYEKFMKEEEENGDSDVNK